jgi:hypothetical protein
VTSIWTHTHTYIYIYISTAVSRWRADGCHIGTCIANLTFDHWSGFYLLCFSVDADMLTCVKHPWKRDNIVGVVSTLTAEWPLNRGYIHGRNMRVFYHWQRPDLIWEIGFLLLQAVKICAPFFGIRVFCTALSCLILPQKLSYILYAVHTESLTKIPTALQQWKI